MKLKHKIVAILGVVALTGGGVILASGPGGADVASASVNAAGATFNNGNPVVAVGRQAALDVGNVDANSIVTVDYDPNVLTLYTGPNGPNMSATTETCTAPSGLACLSYQAQIAGEFDLTFTADAVGPADFSIDVTDDANITGCIE